MRQLPYIPKIPRRIVLVGFMGAGKSTIGPILAERLGWRFIDADHFLEAQTGSTIAELFAQHGEPAFRQLEADAFIELHRREELVIALGGGAVETESTRSRIERAADTCVIFLRAPLEILIERCEKQPDAAVRPILRQRETLTQRFLGRLPHYEQADLSIDTQSLPPHLVADRLLQQLTERYATIHPASKEMAT
jgi:shikimate kinase